MPFELGTKCSGLVDIQLPHDIRIRAHALSVEIRNTRRRLSRDLVATCVLLHQLKEIMGADFDEYACQSLGFARRSLWRYLKVGSGCVEAIKAGGLE